MDKYKLTRKYFIGKNKPGVWASVYAYRPHSEEFFQKRGEIFAVITLKGPKDFDTATAGNLLLDNFHESYFENEKDSPLVALEKAVMSTERRLIALIENEISTIQEGVEVHVLAMVVHDGFVYFVSMGQARVFVFRDGNFLDITSYLKDPTGEDIISVGSSQIEQRDVYMLATPEAIDEYSEDDLVDSVSNFSEQNLKGRMVEDDSKIALVMVKVGKEGVEEPEVAPAKIMEEKIESVEDFDEVEVREKLDEVDLPVGANDDMLEEGLSEDQVPAGFQEQKTMAGNIKDKVKPALDKAVAFLKETKDKVFTKFKGENVSTSTPKSEFAPEVGSESVNQEAKDKEELPTYLYFLKKIGRKIWELVLTAKNAIWKALGLDENKLFLRGAGAQRNWKVIAILIVVIGLILYFGIKAQVQDARQRKLTEEAQTLINNAKSLTDDVNGNVAVVLNSPANTERKNELVSTLDQAMEKLVEAEKLGVLADEINTQKSTIETLKNKLNRVIVISPTLIVDFAAHYENAETYDIDLLGSDLYATDSTRGVIYKMPVSGGEPSEFIPAGSNISGPKSLSFDSTNNLIINDSSEDKPLGTIDMETKAVTKHSGLSLSSLGALVQIEAYKLGDEFRVYAVRNGNKDLVYMRKSASGYSNPILRAKDDAFANATDVAVDGRVYILSKGSGLSRYLGEVKDPVTIEGLPANDSINESVALDIDANRIFFADPTNRRVLVFTKSRGENGSIFDLIAQVKPDGEAFANIKEVVVDVSNNNLYVLDGTKIWKIDLSVTKDFEY